MLLHGTACKFKILASNGHIGLHFLTAKLVKSQYVIFYSEVVRNEALSSFSVEVKRNLVSHIV
jgi:hypothetical protein